MNQLKSSASKLPKRGNQFSLFPEGRGEGERQTIYFQSFPPRYVHIFKGGGSGGGPG